MNCRGTCPAAHRSCKSSGARRGARSAATIAAAADPIETAHAIRWRQADCSLRAVQVGSKGNLSSIRSGTERRQIAPSPTARWPAFLARSTPFQPHGAEAKRIRYLRSSTSFVSSKRAADDLSPEQHYDRRSSPVTRRCSHASLATGPCLSTAASTLVVVISLSSMIVTLRGSCAYPSLRTRLGTGVLHTNERPE